MHGGLWVGDSVFVDTCLVFNILSHMSLPRLQTLRKAKVQQAGKLFLTLDFYLFIYIPCPHSPIKVQPTRFKCVFNCRSTSHSLQFCAETSYLWPEAKETRPPFTS